MKTKRPVRPPKELRGVSIPRLKTILADCTDALYLGLQMGGMTPIDPRLPLIRARIDEILYQKYGSQMVYGVRAADIPALLERDLFIPASENPYLESELLSIGAMTLRHRTEYNPAYRQLIPYGVVCRGDDVFAVRRLMGDGRLVGKISIGQGGHLEPMDFIPGERAAAAALVGLRRELDEELDFHGHPYEISFLGFINDNTNLVGKDHLGLLYRVEASSDAVTVRETDVMTGTFASYRDLLLQLDSMESWSSIAMAALVDHC